MFAATSTLLLAGHATAQCPADDDSGANDTCAGSPDFAAGGVSTPRRVADTQGNGGGASAGDDWWYLTLQPGATATLTANFTHAAGDIDIALFDGCGGGPALATGTSTTNNETVAYTNTNLWPVGLRLRVYMFTTNGCNSYTLTSLVTGGGICTADDLLEIPPGNGDTCASAAVLATPGTLLWLNVKTGDEDWWSITVPPFSAVKATIQFHDDVGDIDMQLYAPCGTLRTGSASTTDDENVQWTNNSAAAIDAKIRVFRFGGASCIDYNLITEIVPCSQLEDAFEPNDTCGTAITRTAGTTTALQVADLNGDGFGAGPGDDWWTISVPDGYRLTVNAIFTHAVADIDIQMFNACAGISVAGGASTTDNETMSWDNTTGSAVDAKVRVYSFTVNGCNLYDLDIALAEIQCISPADDSFEQNDTCGTAVAAFGTNTGLFVSKTDEDWYGTYSVAPGRRFNASALFAQADADIDLRLEGPCGTFRASSTSTSDDESVSWSNTTGAAVQVTLRVYVWSGSASDCGVYDLVTQVIDSACSNAVDDINEPNDDCLSATNVAANSSHPGLFVIGGNDDWFEVSVPNSATLNVGVLFSHASADVDVVAYDACAGSFVAGGFSITDNEFIAFTNQTGSRRNYYIQVYRCCGGDCATYTLNLSTGGGTGSNIVPHCLGDGSGTPRPCMNNSTAGHPGGCAPQNGNGGILTGSGLPSIGGDTLHFDLTSAVQSSFAVLVSGNNKLPQVGCVGCGVQAFDGLRCAGGDFRRHGSRATNAAGTANNGWGPPAGPPGGLAAATSAATGQTRHFFVFFRSDFAQTCFTGQNSSNAVSVTWGP